MPTVLKSLQQLDQQDILRGLASLLAQDDNPRFMLVQLSLPVKLSLQGALAVIKQMPEDLVKRVMDAIEDPDIAMPSAVEFAEAFAWQERNEKE